MARRFTPCGPYNTRRRAWARTERISFDIIFGIAGEWQGVALGVQQGEALGVILGNACGVLALASGRAPSISFFHVQAGNVTSFLHTQMAAQGFWYRIR